jgi:hypothetical protein
MNYQDTDMYQMLSVTLEGVELSSVMTLDALSAHVVQKYKDQPLQYFNEMDRLKVIHLKTGTIKSIRLKIDF